MSVTPNYGFPYPDLDDAPNGPAQLEALANAVDDEITRVDVDVLTAIAQLRADLFVKEDVNTTAENNITSTTFIAGASTQNFTFTAPTSGAVEVDAYVRANADTFTPPAFVLFSYEIRENNVSGTIVVESSALRGGAHVFMVSPQGNNSQSSSTHLHTGLTPGATYFIRSMYSVSSGSSTIDITYRKLTVRGVAAT